jgi:aminoglycoside phosphotransferase (APT) family kinase protein
MMDTSLFDRIAQELEPGGSVHRSWPLTGGVSAQVTALEIACSDGRLRRCVVRQPGATNRQIQARRVLAEFHLLETLSKAGLTVPEPLAVDADGSYLVTTFIESEPLDAGVDFCGAARTMATQLTRIHQLDISQLASLQPHAGFSQPGPFSDESLEESRIRTALERIWPPSMNPSVLLHGDCWPGNVLWKQDAIVAIIDWEDAALGDPLADMANTRLEILWAWGLEALHAFTTTYQKLNPQLNYRALPVWDLVAALRPVGKLGNWGLDARTEAHFRQQHHLFVQTAIAALQTDPDGL